MTLLIFVLRPRVTLLGDIESRDVEFLGRDCDEKRELSKIASLPAERVIIGGWMTPSALLHFSAAMRCTSEGVNDCERCFFEGRRGAPSREYLVGLDCLNTCIGYRMEPIGVVAGDDNRL